jgi:GxxExxY protein
LGLVHEELTEQIIGAAIEVHRHLGPGLLESAYRRCLVHELELREVPVRTEVPVGIDYKGIRLEAGYRLDVLVEDKVVVEVKAVEALEPVYHAQLLTYLRLAGCRVGLLINFNVPVLRDGIKRVVL